MAANELPRITEEDMEALKAAVGKGNLIEAAAKAKEALEMADKITLNIAVTGETGSGKSSFVNAIRGLKQVKFSRYDFFIIISCTRFTSHDIELAQEIQRLGKKFYFVRSKVDVDLTNEKRNYNAAGILEKRKASTKRPLQYSESSILEAIRENCIKGLKAGEVASPRVFLVSRWDLGKYDFPKLQGVLVDELPSHKRLAFLRSLSNASKEILEKKKQQLQRQIWLKSLVSCVVAALPLPGLAIVCDVAVLVTSLKGFCRDFGLDENSLAALARQNNKPIAELKAVIKSPLW